MPPPQPGAMALPGGYDSSHAGLLWECRPEGTVAHARALPLRCSHKFLQQDAALFWRQTELVVDERSFLEGRFAVLIRRPAHLIA